MRKNVITKQNLIDRLNEKCRKAKLYRYGQFDSKEAELGGDTEFFDGESVHEYSDLDFTVDVIADTAKDLNKIRRIFETVAKDLRVSFTGERSSFKAVKQEDCHGEPFWSVLWRFSPNK